MWSAGEHLEGFGDRCFDHTVFLYDGTQPLGPNHAADSDWFVQAGPGESESYERRGVVWRPQISPEFNERIRIRS